MSTNDPRLSDSESESPGTEADVTGAGVTRRESQAQPA